MDDLGARDVSGRFETGPASRLAHRPAHLQTPHPGRMFARLRGDFSGSLAGSLHHKCGHAFVPGMPRAAGRPCVPGVPGQMGLRPDRADGRHGALLQTRLFDSVLPEDGCCGAGVPPAQPAGRRDACTPRRRTDYRTGTSVESQTEPGFRGRTNGDRSPACPVTPARGPRRCSMTTRGSPRAMGVAGRPRGSGHLGPDATAAASDAPRSLAIGPAGVRSDVGLPRRRCDGPVPDAGGRPGRPRGPGQGLRAGRLPIPTSRPARVSSPSRPIRPGPAKRRKRESGPRCRKDPGRRCDRTG
jgi:hypothetical protein